VRSRGPNVKGRHCLSCRLGLLDVSSSAFSGAEKRQHFDLECQRCGAIHRLTADNDLVLRPTKPPKGPS